MITVGGSVGGLKELKLGVGVGLDRLSTLGPICGAYFAVLVLQGHDRVNKKSGK